MGRGQPPKYRKKASARSKVMFSFFDMLLKLRSPTICLALLILTGLLVRSSLSLAVATTLLPSLIFAVIFHRLIILELCILWPTCISFFTSCKLTCRIDDDLFLGSLPLLHDFPEYYMKKLRITSVIAVVDVFELSSSTSCGTPVKAEDWRSEGVEFYHLRVPFFVYYPSIRVLDSGADFINSRLSEKEVVLCHCLSGLYRSTAVIAAYFVKYRKVSVDMAIDMIVARRGLAMTTMGGQELVSALKSYQKYLSTKIR